MIEVYLRFPDIYPCLGVLPNTLGFVPQYTPQVFRHLSMCRGLAQHTWVCATIHTLGFQTSIHVQGSCPTHLGLCHNTHFRFSDIYPCLEVLPNTTGLCHNIHLRFSDIYPCLEVLPITWVCATIHTLGFQTSIHVQGSCPTSLGFVPQYTPQVFKHLSMSRGLAQHTWVCATIHTLGFQTSIHVLGSYHNTHLRFPDIYPCLEVLPNTIQVCALIHHSGFLMPIHDHGFVPKYTFKVFKFPNTYPMPLINSL